MIIARLAESLRRRQRGRFSKIRRKRFRMETKEIAMQKRTTMMGTACVLAAAALTASPAAAATLTDFAGALNTSFMNSDSSVSNSESVKSWLIGGSAAMPLSTIDGLNAQLDASYTHN